MPLRERIDRLEREPMPVGMGEGPIEIWLPDNGRDGGTQIGRHVTPTAVLVIYDPARTGRE